MNRVFRRVTRDEAGEPALALLAVAVGAAFAAMMVYALAGDYGADQQTAQPGPPAFTNFTESPMPGPNDARFACYNTHRITEKGTLVWNANLTPPQWTIPDEPRPTLVLNYNTRGNYTADSKAVAKWDADMRAALDAAKFSECDQEQTPPPVHEPEPAEPNITGTYAATLAYQGGPAACQVFNGATLPLQVTQPNRGLVSIRTPTTTFQGGLSGGSFDLRAAVEGASDANIRGVFRVSGDEAQIVSGFLFDTGTDATGCSYTFEAPRTHS